MQWIGAVLGLTGALLVAQVSPRWRRWGFRGWILSNIALGIFAANAHAWPLLGMYVLYGLTSILGLCNSYRVQQG